MPRNFDGRYELFFPVNDPAARSMVLGELQAQLGDDVNAFQLLEDGAEVPNWDGRHNAQRPDGHRQLAQPRRRR
jgi:polyphosphate kinase